MCLIARLENKYFIIIQTVVSIAIGVIHYFYSKYTRVTYFNTYDLFDSSPLFDFSVSDNCQGKASISFHRWGGRAKIEYTWNREFRTVKEIIPYDQTDIRILNGNYLCYKHISYKDLLNNGQIIKKGEKCPTKYKLNCGRIDTLEQELCIEDTENCPLYDLGLGNPPDEINYTYNEKNSNVYYNNEKFNRINQTIIGRLILNEGQPCYNSTEKLWRAFSSEEAIETHLKCSFGVKKKFNDDRYKEKGSITYKKIYTDNLNKECLNLLYGKLDDYLSVFLYKREFFGLDKKCFEKYESNFNEDSYDTIHNSEKSENLLLYVEGFLIIVFGIVYFAWVLAFIFLWKEASGKIIFYTIGYGIYLALLFICFICHAVYYSRIKKNDITGFNCSDPLTNEVIKKGNEEHERNIKYIAVNFYLELVMFLEHIISLIIGVYLNYSDRKKEYKKYFEEMEKNKENDINKKNEENNSEIPLNTYYPTPS